MDEIIDAFRVDAFHVGMDEVFLLGSDFSPSTKGKDPGELFAKAVNDIHNHLPMALRKDGCISFDSYLHRKRISCASNKLEKSRGSQSPDPV